MRKQQKKTKEMLSALKKGDRIVTASGIHGTVAGIEEGFIWVKIAEQVKVKMNRSAIASVLGEGEQGKDLAPS
jgi:preprotein translocase subunit YajC